jgi:hypothetical protein
MSKNVRLPLRCGGRRFLKTFIPIYQTTWHHIPEDHNLNTHLCENFKSRADVKTYTPGILRDIRFEVPQRWL